MQCLARAVARSAGAAATECYGGRRFASTGSRGRSAVRQRREQHQVQRILAKLAAMEGNLDKLEKVPLGVGFVIRTRFGAAISGVLIARLLFGKDEEVSPNTNGID